MYESNSMQRLIATLVDPLWPEDKLQHFYVILSGRISSAEKDKHPEPILRENC